MSFDFCAGLRERIAANLAAFDHKTRVDAQLRRAAVAIVVIPKPENGTASVLLTRRSSQMRRHRGQYALPGGRLDAGETPEQAALRELSEELGLSLEYRDILGPLDDYSTRSGFRITPIVMWFDGGQNIVPDPNEVERVFHIGLSELDSPDIPTLTTAEEGDRSLLSAFLPTLGHEIYAPTAAMLYQFREVGLRGTNTRVAQYDEPAFAWK